MGAKRNKARGFEFERELVNKAKEVGLSAQRAWGSNGRSLGCAETVDCLIDGVRVQAKRRKSIADYLKPPEGADIVAVREERQQPYVVIPFEEWLRLRKIAAQLNNEDPPLNRKADPDWSEEGD